MTKRNSRNGSSPSVFFADGILPVRSRAAVTVRNMLTQKGQGPRSRSTAKLDLSHLKPGGVCGLGVRPSFQLPGSGEGRESATRLGGLLEF
jgi:hypothetical protein